VGVTPDSTGNAGNAFSLLQNHGTLPDWYDLLMFDKLFIFNSIQVNMKTLQKLMFSVLLLTPATTFSQPGTLLLEKRLGGNALDVARSIHCTPDKGFFIVGSTESALSGDVSESPRGALDYWVIKVDSLFNKQWDKRFGGPIQDFGTAGGPALDGGYFVAGVSYSGQAGDKSQPSRGNGDFWIVKLDSSGNKLWDKRFGGNKFDILFDAIQTQDGGFILAGNSRSFTGGDITSTLLCSAYSGWMIKIDSLGNKLWDKGFSYGGCNQVTIRRIIEMPNKDFIISGGHMQYDRYFVNRYNSMGDILWSHRYTDGRLSADVTPAFDGGYLFGGVHFAVYLNYYQVMKIDSAGGIQWIKEYGGNRHNILVSVIQLPSDSSYVLTGYSFSGAGGSKTQPNHDPAQASADIWVINIDVSGNKIWDKRYGGTHDDFAFAAKDCGDGTMVIAGQSMSGISGDKTEDHRGGGDIWLLKIDLKP
jgi:hypothetical protein